MVLPASNILNVPSGIPLVHHCRFLVVHFWFRLFLKEFFSVCGGFICQPLKSTEVSLQFTLDFACYGYERHYDLSIIGPFLMYYCNSVDFLYIGNYGKIDSYMFETLPATSSHLIPPITIYIKFQNTLAIFFPCFIPQVT